MRTNATIVGFAVALFLSVLAVGALGGHAQSTPPPQAQSVATPGTRTPDAAWLKTFDEFAKRNVALGKKRADFEAKMQPEVDALTGISQRLIGQIPTGYQFDATTRLFTLIPPAPAPAPAPAEGTK